MPKKSNKTAHVLNLLTNGSDEIATHDNEADSPSPVVITNEESKLEINTSVLVQIQGETEHDLLSDLVKKELEQELIQQKIQATIPEPVTDILISLKEDPINLEDVKSEKFILEEFDEEFDEEEEVKEAEVQPMVVDQAIVNDYQPIQADNTKILHNLAEDVIRAKVPEVMKSFNMCTCQSCVYDVMAFALNHVAPLYTVTEKGHLFQKLTSYESQYGTDLTSAITKACIKVKINPNHAKSDSNI